MSTERFTVGTQTVRGQPRPVVQRPTDDRRQRKFFRSRAEARAYAADQNRERADLGALFVHLTPAQKAELVGVWNDAQWPPASACLPPSIITASTSRPPPRPLSPAPPWETPSPNSLPPSAPPTAAPPTSPT